MTAVAHDNPLAILHVVDGDDTLVYDLAFLAVGVVMGAGGFRLSRSYSANRSAAA